MASICLSLFSTLSTDTSDKAAIQSLKCGYRGSFLTYSLFHADYKYSLSLQGQQSHPWSLSLRNWQRHSRFAFKVASCLYSNVHFPLLGNSWSPYWSFLNVRWDSCLLYYFFFWLISISKIFVPKNTGTWVTIFYDTLHRAQERRLTQGSDLLKVE